MVCLISTVRQSSSNTDCYSVMDKPAQPDYEIQGNVAMHPLPQGKEKPSRDGNA